MSQVVAFPDAGTPTQEQVDCSLLYLDGLNDAVDCIDPEAYLKQEAEKVITQLQEKVDEVTQKQTQQSQNPILEKAQELMQQFAQFIQLIKPLLDFDLSLDTILEWAKNVALFFEKFFLWWFIPFEKLLKVIEFSIAYLTAVITKCGTLIATLTSKISELESISPVVLSSQQKNSIERLKLKLQSAKIQNQNLKKKRAELQSYASTIKSMMEKSKQLVEKSKK